MSIPLDARRVEAVRKKIERIEREAKYMERQARALRVRADALRHTWGIDPPCPCRGDCILEKSNHPDEQRMCPHWSGT